MKMPMQMLIASTNRDKREYLETIEASLLSWLISLFVSLTWTESFWKAANSSGVAGLRPQWTRMALYSSRSSGLMLTWSRISLKSFAWMSSLCWRLHLPTSDFYGSSLRCVNGEYSNVPVHKNLIHICLAYTLKNNRIKKTWKMIFF